MFSLHTAFQALTLSCNDESGASLSQTTESFRDTWRSGQVLKHIVELQAWGPRYLRHCGKRVSAGAPWRAPQPESSPHRELLTHHHLLSRPRNQAFGLSSSEPPRRLRALGSLFGKFEKLCLNVHFIGTSWKGGKAPPPARFPRVVCKTEGITISI